MMVPIDGTADRVTDDGVTAERPPELVDVTELLVRAQSGEARAVLSQVDALETAATPQYAGPSFHDRAQWLRFARFVALHELRIVGTADQVAAEMIRLAEPYDDRPWQALGYALRGQSLLLQRQFESAYDELARSVVLLEEVDEINYQVGHATNAAALTLGRLDLYELADEWLGRLNRAAEHLGDTMLRTLYAFNSVWLHLKWGFELDLIGDNSQAQRHYRLAVDGFESAPTGNGLVRDSAWPSEVTLHGSAARAMLGGGIELENDLRKHLEVVAPTHRQEATLTGHLALGKVYANEGDTIRAMEELEVACAAGATLPRLQIPAARAYAAYADLLRQRSGSSPVAEAYAELTSRLLRDRWDERRGRVTSFEDRLTHERARDELRRRAAAYLTDPLTGLGNRRQIEIRLPELLLESAAAGRPLSVAFADIDDFKSVNDDLSHLAGDGLLRELSQQMRALLDPADVLARFGGEEFVIVLPDRTAEAAYRTMDQMRTQVQQRVWRSLPGDRRITITIGLAESWDGASRTQMLAAADKAMLEAKRSGKNRVSIHQHRG